jgi:hypothetical protein
LVIGAGEIGEPKIASLLAAKGSVQGGSASCSEVTEGRASEIATEHEGNSTLLGTDTEKEPRLCAGDESCFQSERSFVGFRRRPASRGGRSLLVPIEPAQESAWMDHDVFLMVADFFPMPFRCS